MLALAENNPAVRVTGAVEEIRPYVNEAAVDAGPGGYIPISISSDAAGLRKVFRRILNLWKESRSRGRIPEQIAVIPEY